MRAVDVDFGNAEKVLTLQGFEPAVAKKVAKAVVEKDAVKLQSIILDKEGVEGEKVLSALGVDKAGAADGDRLLLKLTDRIEDDLETHVETYLGKQLEQAERELDARRSRQRASRRSTAAGSRPEQLVGSPPAAEGPLEGMKAEPRRKAAPPSAIMRLCCCCLLGPEQEEEELHFADGALGEPLLEQDIGIAKSLPARDDHDPLREQDQQTRKSRRKSSRTISTSDVIRAPGPASQAPVDAAEDEHQYDELTAAPAPEEVVAIMEQEAETALLAVGFERRQARKLAKKMAEKHGNADEALDEETKMAVINAGLGAETVTMGDLTGKLMQVQSQCFIQSLSPMSFANYAGGAGGMSLVQSFAMHSLQSGMISGAVPISDLTSGGFDNFDPRQMQDAPANRRQAAKKKILEQNESAK
ncbi:unnamed protein product [Amoebophrya sp. A120]|nr:unnamed protein product [Amoebophrya sp. A120]|eukprot:GSA120T00021403001.1